MRAVSQIEALPANPAPRARRRAGPKPAGPDAAPQESPAIALQADLSARWEAAGEIDDTPSWSPRRMLALAGGVSLVLWLAIGFAIKAAIGG